MQEDDNECSSIGLLNIGVLYIVQLGELRFRLRDPPPT